MKVYVTRHALTKGIFVTSAEKIRRIKYHHKGYWESYCSHDYQHTPEEAIRAAEQIRDRAIASLEKQIDKLRSMKFEVTD